MNCKIIFKNILLAVFVLGMGLVLCPNNTAAFSLNNAQIDHIVHSEANYKINTIFMELHQKKGYVIVGEEVFYLMDFRSENKQYKTTFVNKQGVESYADSLKPSEWARKEVILKGYRLDNGKMVAESIKRVELSHK